MEILGARPAWSKTSSERLQVLDAVETELARLKTVRLHYMASVDDSGDAADLGAHDTVELLSLRHNRHPRDVRRDLTLAKALPKYPAVSAALPDPADLGSDLDDHVASDADLDATSKVISPPPRTPRRTVPRTRTRTLTRMRTVPSTRTSMRAVPSRMLGCGGGW